MQRSADIQRHLALQQSVATIHLITRVWNGLKKLILQLQHERNLSTIVQEKDQQIQALLVGFEKEKEAWRRQEEGVQQSLRSVVQSLQDSNLESSRKLEGVRHSLRIVSLSLAVSNCISLLYLFAQLMITSLQAQHEILHLKQLLGAQNAELKRSLAAQDVEKISWEEARKAERRLSEKARDQERQSWEREQENLQRKQRQLHVCFCASVRALG